MWFFIELSSCGSTFNEARQYPAWTVVRAEQQEQGRGRFNRRWFGEPGGMWATFNVPLTPPDRQDWGLLPLLAGVAIMRALARYRIGGLRLRWPNDVLVGRSKLAGILVERPRADLGSIGIGLNIHNDIQSLVGRVQDAPARLADLVPECPTVAEFTAQLAEAIAAAFAEFEQGGIAAIEAELQRAWGEPRAVEVQTDDGSIYGDFIGIQPDGSPLLRQPGGSCIAVPASKVNRLIESQEECRM